MLPRQQGTRQGILKRSRRPYRFLSPRQHPLRNELPPSTRAGSRVSSNPPPASRKRGLSVLSPKSCPRAMMACSRISERAPNTFSMTKGRPRAFRASLIAAIRRSADDAAPANVAVEKPSHGGEAGSSSPSTRLSSREVARYGEDVVSVRGTGMGVLIASRCPAECPAAEATSSPLWAVHLICALRPRRRVPWGWTRVTCRTVG